MTDDLLQQYKVVVDFLGKALGPDYEVTLHDLTSENAGIVAIANGEISGRDLGSPVTSAALTMLAQKEYENADYRLNYTGLLASGKTIRSSTMFIKDHNGKPVGLLCVNFDDSRFNALSNDFFRLLHPESFIQQNYVVSEGKLGFARRDDGSSAEITENYHSDIRELMQEVFDEVSKDYPVSLKRLTQSERTELVARLDRRGLFRLKGAVQFVSEQIYCSCASVYRYLGKARQED